MTALNFKTIVIGLASLLMVSVAQAKCYPGLDCPEDLPNANNTPSQQSTIPIPPTSQQKTEPKTESTAPPEEVTPVEQETVVDKMVGWKVATPVESTEESNSSESEESPTLTKYGKYSKYSKYPK